MSDISNLITQFVLIVFPLLFFNITLTFKVKRIIFNCVAYSAFAVMTLLAYNLDKSFIPMLIFHAILTSLILFMAKDTIVIKIAVIVINYICLVYADVLAVTIVNCISKNEESKSSVIAVAVYSFLCLILFYYARVINSIKEYNKLSNWIAFIIILEVKIKPLQVVVAEYYRM